MSASDRSGAARRSALAAPFFWVAGSCCVVGPARLIATIAARRDRALGAAPDVTVVFWLGDRPETKAEAVDDVWHALALGCWLASPTALDHDVGFLERHIHNGRQAIQSYEGLWACARDWSDGVEWILIARSYHAFLEREIAKTPWLSLVPLAGEIKTAFDRWLTAGREIPGTFPAGSSRPGNACRVASTRLSFTDRETALLVMMAQWLTGIEYPILAPLYIYDAPCQSEFDCAIPHLPALDLPQIAGID